MSWKEISGAIGLAEGGAVRNAVETVWSALGLDRLGERTPVRQRVAFTIAFVALAAKLSKADGVSVAVEGEAFERMYAVPESERGNVRRLFDLAKRDVAGFESYARTIAGYLEEEPALINDVFECLFHVACADGVLHPGEERYLQSVAACFGLGDDEFRSIRSYYVSDPADPYLVLGIRPDASDQEIKARYRALAAESHPDSMIARGVPEALRTAAERKIRAVNVAYETIVKARARARVSGGERPAGSGTLAKDRTPTGAVS